MDIHVDIRRIDFKIDKIRHLLAHRDKTLEGSGNSLIEIWMAHITAVDKEILMHSFLLCRLGFAHITGDFTHRGVYVYRQQVLVYPLAEDVDNALAQIAGTEIEQLGVVAVQGKGDLRIYECDALESGDDIVQLGCVRLQELPAGGNVEEKVFHLEVAARRTGTRFLHDMLASGDGKHRSDLIFGTSGRQFYLRHGCDRGECFSAEAHRGEGKEVFGIADFRRGMTLKGYARIGVRHSFTVIGNLNQCASGVYHKNIHILRPRIDGVLHKFFYYRSRPLDYFSGGYLIGYVVG